MNDTQNSVWITQFMSYELFMHKVLIFLWCKRWRKVKNKRHFPPSKQRNFSSTGISLICDGNYHRSAELPLPFIKNSIPSRMCSKLLNYSNENKKKEKSRSTHYNLLYESINLETISNEKVAHVMLQVTISLILLQFYF